VVHCPLSAQRELHARPGKLYQREHPEQPQRGVVRNCVNVAAYGIAVVYKFIYGSGIIRRRYCRSRRERQDRGNRNR
jgi:hypothetical protein